MQLIIFPTPIDARCELFHDTAGWSLVGAPAVHPTGRIGQGFDIPDGTSQGHGAKLIVTAPHKVPIVQRGILFLNIHGFAYPWTPGQTAAFTADDFTLSDANVTLPRLVPQGQFLVQEPA